MMEDLLKYAVNYATKLGAIYADARYQCVTTSSVVVEKGIVKSCSTNRLLGIGIRVMLGSWGFSSTNNLTKASVKESVKDALRVAKSSRSLAMASKLAEVRPSKGSFISPVKVKPEDVSQEELIDLTISANKASIVSDAIKSAITHLGMYEDERFFVSSEGSDIRVKVTMTGLSHLSVAVDRGNMERVFDQMSYCAGYEFIKENDWQSFTKDLSETSIEAVKSDVPKAGNYEVVMDPKLIGLFLHEALGHASEGDLVAKGSSILRGRLGQHVASELVTIVDDGYVEGGFYVPYDDEGVRKTETVVVEKGVLKTHLSSRIVSSSLGIPLTGNARAEDFNNIPLVRQTNFYMKGGDMSFEELIEDVKDGLYLVGRGGGGEVDVGGATFTFSIGPSYRIKGGELKGMIRGTTVSGSILETLKTVDGVGKDVKVTTSVFGGCGKDGQLAKVGDGGPHVRVRSLRVGGKG